LSEVLMLADPRGRAETLEMAFAALNSVEMASLSWSIFQFSGFTGDTPGWKRLEQFLNARLKHMEAVLAGRQWLAGSFTVAEDIVPQLSRLLGKRRFTQEVDRQTAPRISWDIFQSEVGDEIVPRSIRMVSCNVTKASRQMVLHAKARID